jgi:hypothetical protein
MAAAARGRWHATVEMGEKRAAVASVVRLVKAASGDGSGEKSGDEAADTRKPAEGDPSNRPYAQYLLGAGDGT